MGMDPIDPGRALIDALVGTPRPVRESADMFRLLTRLWEAEHYLDQCVDNLVNVDIATMRNILRGGVPAEMEDEVITCPNCGQWHERPRRVPVRLDVQP